MSAPTLTRAPRRRPSHARARGWRFPWAQAVPCVLILLGLCVLQYPSVASWFSQREQSRVTELAQEAIELPPHDDPAYRAEQLDRAHAYNQALASGAVLAANANVPIGDGESTDTSLVYADLLDVAGNGFMGRLRYDALTLDLPIYHGTADGTLEHGVGHLEGTSLPVGGTGTRAILTAHRGLPTATLFNDLDTAQIGDTFTVSVLDQVLTYQVIETKVINPEDTEQLVADPARDLVTLVTCTPLGVNSHRILVTAERVTPTTPEDLEAARAAPDIPGFPWWALILGVGTVATVGYVVSAGFPRTAKSTA
ncbi:MAG: class C sortase [Cellulomonadaceae bacterium]